MAADGDLYRRNLVRFRANYAAELGCDESAFDSNALTVAARPATARSTAPAFIATFGTGTVVSVDPAYVDWANRYPLEKHFHAFNTTGFLAELQAEMARRGLAVAARGTGLGFVAESIPVAPTLPAGVQVQPIDAAWRAKHQATGVFHNSLGDAVDEYANTYWRGGLALVDSGGEPIAVAGTYDDGPSLLEVGLDVRRDQRGKGFAPAIVSLISREIHDNDLTATYYCGAGNVRSHRTALSAGFVPVATNTGLRVRPAPPA